MSFMYPSPGGAAARPCMSCGTPLPPNESQCSRCGTYNQPPQQEQQFRMFQPGNGSGPSGLSWGSQVAQTPPFPPAGDPGSAPGWGSTGQAGEWLQNNPFIGQNQPSSPSQQPQQGLFRTAPGIGQFGQEQSALNNPNQSTINNSFTPFLQNPNQSTFNNVNQLNDASRPFPQSPHQSALGNGVFHNGMPQNGYGASQSLSNAYTSFPQNPNQSILNNPNQLNNAFAPFPQDPNQSVPGSGFFKSERQQQNGYGASQSGMGLLSRQAQRNQPEYQANQSSGNNKDEDESPGKRPNVPVLVGVVILVLLLVGGGAYGVFYLLWHNHSRGNIAITLSPVVTPNMAPLFSDTFQNNNNSWDTTSPQGASISLVGDGKLVLEDDNNELFQEILPGGKTFSDLRVDVDAGLTQGDQANGYGIYIRGAIDSSGNLGTYYCFEAYGDGTFAVYKGVQNADGSSSRTPLKSKTVNAAILYAGQTNHLTVIAQGTQMTFQINGITTYTFSDDSYKGGTVALFVSNVSNVKAGAQAVFERLALFPVS